MLKRRKLDDTEVALERVRFFHREGYIGNQVTPNLDVTSIMNENFGAAVKKGGDEPGAMNIVASILSVLIAFMLVPLHWAALIFESFLHHKFGRFYISPLVMIVSLLLFAFSLFAMSDYWGVIVGVGISAAQAYAFSQFPIFLTLSSILIWAHYFDSIRDYKNHPRHSKSSGVPWVYTLTKNDMFLSSAYVYYIQPLIILLIGFVVIQSNEASGRVLIILSSMYFIRNIISHQLMVYEDIKQNDSAILSEYKMSLRKIEEEEMKNLLEKNYKEHKLKDTEIHINETSSIIPRQAN